MIKQRVGHATLGLRSVRGTMLASILWVSDAYAQRRVLPSEVRQIVTFLFQPGRTGDAVAIYERQLKPIYEGVGPLRRFRAYREAESPEPLDLVVVSSYDGMAGMDAANDALRQTSAFALYGTLSGMTQTHHDQFVEMIPSLSDTTRTGSSLVVYEYVRVAPGAHEEFERRLRHRVRPREKKQALCEWSETGRMLVSDGWDYVRIFGINSLGDWQRIQQALQSDDATLTTIAARKTIILRADPTLSVR